jgi:molecular chaperone DnaK (HSP70)
VRQFRLRPHEPKELSRARAVQIHFEAENIRLREMITNTRLTTLIRREVAEIEQAIDRVLVAAGLEPDQIDLVVRTGGTSEVAAFISLLERKFGADKVVSRRERLLTDAFFASALSTRWPPIHRPIVMKVPCQLR